MSLSASGESAAIPAVCFISDVAKALRMSRRSIERLRRHKAFPIRELVTLDSRPRWSGDDVRKFLARRA